MKRIFGIITGVLVIAAGVLLLQQSNGQAATDGFSLQVTPSPLITSVKPGEKKTVELKIRNTNSEPERLKMSLQGFSVNNDNSISLSESTPSDVASWVSFSDPVFNIDAGQWFTQMVTFDTPSTAGFSYSFAIVISREKSETPGTGETSLEGSVAVFTLLSVERQGVTRGFSISEVTLTRHVYEYLPVDISVKIKNTGNTFVQPQGNIFIQRTPKDTEPLSVLPLNEANSYVLPETERTLKAQWSDGFPVYVEQADGSKKLVWDWSKLTSLRIGRYVVKVVAIYDDGQRDVPVEAEASFWVIPWKLILCVVVILTLLIIGVATIIKKVITVSKRKKRHAIKVE